ncbi:MAG: hypothetical protein AAF468_00780 [Pseudomonadota bacterium]
MSALPLKVLGMGVYEARWIGRSFLVRLTARGILPCSNYEAALEQRPEKIFPPMWNMVFYVSETCEKGLKYFEESVTVYAEGADSLTVHDATGGHDVPIQPAFPLRTDENNAAFAEPEKLCVYAVLPAPIDGHRGCLIVPCGTILPAIYYPAFGPASREECEEFVASNCVTLPKEFKSLTAGGEIPWPLLTAK